MEINHRRIVSWFSCGAASAVATKIAIDKYFKSRSQDNFTHELAGQTVDVPEIEEVDLDGL